MAVGHTAGQADRARLGSGRCSGRCGKRAQRREVSMPQTSAEVWRIAARDEGIREAGGQEDRSRQGETRAVAGPQRPLAHRLCVALAPLRLPLLATPPSPAPPAALACRPIRGESCWSMPPTLLHRVPGMTTCQGQHVRTPDTLGLCATTGLPPRPSPGRGRT